MLKPLGGYVAFVAIFVVAMVFLLVLTLEAFAVIAGEGGVFAFPWGKLARLQGTFFATIFFMLFSGFLPAYVVMYCILLHRISRSPRILLSVLIFVFSFTFFWILVSDWSIRSEIWLLLPGVMSVAISDLLAEIGTRKLRA